MDEFMEKFESEKEKLTQRIAEQYSRNIITQNDNKITISKLFKRYVELSKKIIEKSLNDMENYSKFRY
jgi:hypothetical protein